MNVGIDKNHLSEFAKAFKEIPLIGTKKIIEGRKSERDTNEKGILERILWNEPNGRSTSELKVDTGLHRDTINEICTDLIKQGLITKTNKRGKYHLTEKAYGNNRVRTHLFKQNIIAKILNWDIPQDKENAYCKIDEKESERYDQGMYSLFKFSNRISAVIVYTIMEAIRPGKWDLTIDTIGEENKNKKIGTSGKNKDRFTEELIQEVLDARNLLRLFSKNSNIMMLSIDSDSESKRSRLKKSDTGTWIQPAPKWTMRPPCYHSLSEDEKCKIDDEIEIYLQNWRDNYLSHSTWEMDMETYDSLVGNFKKLFPVIYEELESIKNSLDDQVKDLIHHQATVHTHKANIKKKINIQ